MKTTPKGSRAVICPQEKPLKRNKNTLEILPYHELQTSNLTKTKTKNHFVSQTKSNLQRNTDITATNGNLRNKMASVPV